MKDTPRPKPTKVLTQTPKQKGPLKAITLTPVAQTPKLTARLSVPAANVPAEPSFSRYGGFVDDDDDNEEEENEQDGLPLFVLFYLTSAIVS